MFNKKPESKNQKKPLYYEAFFKGANQILIQPWVEIVSGMYSKRFPIYQAMLTSLILQIAYLLNIDSLLYQRLGLMDHHPFHISYRIVITVLPFWSWGMMQVILRIKLIRQLTQIFKEAGLKSITGRLPGFIYDKALDKFTRRMRLSKSGQSLEKFENAKPDLESGLQVFIDEITENRQNGTVDIVYSHAPLSDKFEIKDFSEVPENQFLVGKGRSKVLKSHFADTPHLLVAGQTGMGKSTFLRQLICSLYLRNKSYSFDLVDLKGGLEFQIFENLPRVNVKTNVASALVVLQNLAEKEIKYRSDLLKLNNCKDIEAFHKLEKKDRLFPDNGYQFKSLERHIVVVDEAFDLFMAGPHANANDVKNARRHASKIAAQGRAVGINLVIATQRPDRFAIDPQTKSNLTGKICFRLPNLASSLTVMDNKRAAELPNIKGRAIWQNSADQFEIQTPLYTEDQAQLDLEKFYSSKSKGKLPDDMEFSNSTDDTPFDI